MTAFSKTKAKEILQRAVEAQVMFAPGAIYGYCPKCGAPGEMRDSGKDRCQNKHTYQSIEAMWSPIKTRKR